MKVEPLNVFNNPKEYIYIDANIFHLAIRDTGNIGKTCVNFLRKIETGTIKGITSVLVLDELMYKLMLKLIESKYKTNPLTLLRKKKVSETIFEVVETLVEGIISIKNLGIIEIPATVAFMMTYNFKKFHILPRDAIHASIMELYGIKNIASADKDFDVIDWIYRWTPF